MNPDFDSSPSPIDIGLRSATAFAPATVGNVGVGFDILGFALQDIGDRITVTRIEEREVRLAGITGADVALPDDPRQNTATAGLLRLLEDRNLPFGFEVRVEKGIALGSGMGGSAASAVGAIVAASALLDERLPLAERFAYALHGEQVACGSAHGDNIAPCLLGGLTLVRSLAPPDVVRIPVTPIVQAVLVHPHLRLDTREARGVLRPDVSLADMVHQSSNLAGFLAGCFTDDWELIGRSLRDVVIEPQRAKLIPGFAKVQQAAFDHGALGCTISGAGPSVFALYGPLTDGEAIRDAMVEAFAAEGLACDAYLSTVNSLGAHLVAREPMSV